MGGFRLNSELQPTVLTNQVFKNFFPRRVLTPEERSEEGVKLLEFLDKNHDDQVDFSEARFYTRFYPPPFVYVIYSRAAL